jgi:hypothetical protein
MIYKVITGLNGESQIINSGTNSVVFNCVLPIGLDHTCGTFESLETSNLNGVLKQMKIVRVCDSNRNLTVTVTERTQQEIQDYFTNITPIIPTLGLPDPQPSTNPVLPPQPIATSSFTYPPRNII